MRNRELGGRIGFGRLVVDVPEFPRSRIHREGDGLDIALAVHEALQGEAARIEAAAQEGEKAGSFVDLARPEGMVGDMNEAGGVLRRSIVQSDYWTELGRTVDEGAETSREGV